MGTTLTGTTPQDTYDSLIKVTDNGPLSGSLKTLTDGLGNDSALALSTGAASITGTLTTSSITRAERLQVGTAATLNDATGVGNTLQFANYSPSVFVTGSADSYIYKNSSVFGGLAAQSLVFQTRSDVTGGGFSFVAGGTPAVVATITGAGNVGIGTSAPVGFASDDVVLQIHNATASPAASRSIFRLTNSYTGDTFGNGSGLFVDNNVHLNVINYENADIVFLSNNGTSVTEKGRFLAGGGLTFNGDTAAANALDDYEEGTWTMGLAFDNGATGVTYSSNTGRYTKIGRQVTAVGYLALTNKGSSTGNATITGLPFTIGAGNSNYCSASISNLANVTFADFPQLRGEIGTTNILFLESTNAGALSALANGDFANNSEVIISFTYFV
jgi:hypothetical protein